MDIVDKLQAWADHETGEPMPNNWGTGLTHDLEEAIAEIKRLRSLAGAVSDGPSAAEVLAPLRHKVTYTD